MREIPFGKPIIEREEKEAVARVLECPTLTHGPLMKQFEADFAAFTKAPHAVAVSSATAGLHLAYLALGIGAGDQVIVPSQSHVATAHAVELVGATPVFADAEERTGNIDTAKLDWLVTLRTKAISVVHYLGMPVDMRIIREFAEKHNLRIVEDCALAIGSYLDNVHAGLWGDLGVFSFYPVKHITTAEGGMVITKDAKLAEKISRLRAFGIDRNFVSERKIPGMYDVQELGYNYRINEIGAALGIEQIKKIPRFLAARERNWNAMRSAIEGVPGIRTFQSTGGSFVSSYYCFSVLLDQPLAEERYRIMEMLKERGVGTSIYYPHAIPEMTYYKKKYSLAPSNYPVAKRISDTIIALPVGPHLDEEDMTYIGQNLAEIIKEVRI